MTSTATERTLSRLQIRSAILTALLSTGVAEAASGDAAFMSGSYTITPNSSGTEVTFDVAGIENTTSNATTGSLGFELWYSPAPYSGGTLNGYKVSAAYLPLGNCASQLAPGVTCTGISVQSSVTEPPAGTYYPVLLLVEYSTSCQTDNGYCSDDFEALTNLTTGGPTVTVTQGAGGGGGGGASGTSGNAELQGTVQTSAIDWTSDTMSISVADVTNISNVTTGSLQIQLWFTSTPFTGGSISSGYKVASFPLPSSCTTGNAQLVAGNSCTSIQSGTLAVTAPPSGTYYAAVLLEEYAPNNCPSNGGYCLDNGVALSTQVTVPQPVVAPTTTTSSSASSGGGGGGSLDSGTLSIFGFATLLGLLRRMWGGAG